ncbi:MAG TPA: DUF3788 domain-containing protein [Candidatus Hydrogenedentes bacterium]|nr:DUF3788 domain-containing protein [Candidatus Hydrogenedentota bacterium]HPG68640.1 DUF3788 domain-containing protein [Candidatus Hydrogenedentota bacterium]
MNEPNARMTQSDHQPTDAEAGIWLGREARKYWTQVRRLIEETYPSVFVPEWLFGGKKHGWSLRYKKSKSFCTLIPEKDRFALLIVFGAEERAKVETIRNSLSQYTQEEYDKATTYHDGKWLLLDVDSDRVVADVMQLLAVKRRSKKR